MKRKKAIAYGFNGLVEQEKAITHGLRDLAEDMKAIAHGFNELAKVVKAIMDGFHDLEESTKAIACGFWLISDIDGVDFLPAKQWIDSVEGVPISNVVLTDFVQVVPHRNVAYETAALNQIRIEGRRTPNTSQIIDPARYT